MGVFLYIWWCLISAIYGSALFVNFVDSVDTFSNNVIKYCSRDYSKALLAHKIHMIIGHPSMKTLLYFINNILWPRCPVASREMLAANDIFGRDIGSFKGRTTRRKPEKVIIYQQLTLPVDVLTRYQDVTLEVHIMFVNKLLSLIVHLAILDLEPLKLLRMRKQPPL